MNVTRRGEEHEAAIQRILKAAKTAGKKAAIFCKSSSLKHVSPLELFIVTLDNILSYHSNQEISN